MSFIPKDMNIPHEFIKTKTIGKCAVCNHPMISVKIEPPENEFEHNQTDLNLQNLYKKEQERINKRFEEMQPLIIPCPTCGKKDCIVYVNNIRTHINHLDDVLCCNRCLHFPIAIAELYHDGKLFELLNIYECTLNDSTIKNRVYFTNEHPLSSIIRKCFQELTTISYDPYNSNVRIHQDDECDELLHKNNMFYIVHLQKNTPWK